MGRSLQQAFPRVRVGFDMILGEHGAVAGHDAHRRIDGQGHTTPFALELAIHLRFGRPSPTVDPGLIPKLPRRDPGIAANNGFPSIDKLAQVTGRPVHVRAARQVRPHPLAEVVADNRQDPGVVVEAILPGPIHGGGVQLARALGPLGNLGNHGIEMSPLHLHADRLQEAQLQAGSDAGGVGGKERIGTHSAMMRGNDADAGASLTGLTVSLAGRKHLKEPLPRLKLDGIGHRGALRRQLQAQLLPPFHRLPENVQRCELHQDVSASRGFARGVQRDPDGLGRTVGRLWIHAEDAILRNEFETNLGVGRKGVKEGKEEEYSQEVFHERRCYLGRGLRPGC